MPASLSFHNLRVQLCAEIQPDLPTECTCKDVAGEPLGGDLTCAVDLETGITINSVALAVKGSFELDLLPCGSPASLALTAAVTSPAGMKPITEKITASMPPGTISVPVPGIPAGLNINIAYAITEGAGAFDVTLGLDLCAGISIGPTSYTVCLSTLNDISKVDPTTCSVIPGLNTLAECEECAVAKLLAAANGGTMPDLPKFPYPVFDVR